MLKKIFLFLLYNCLFFFAAYSQKLDSLRGELQEVEIKIKFNPAIPIIKKTIKNRNINSQFSNHHFSYTSYQKMFFTGDIQRDSILLNTAMQFADSLHSDSTSFSKKDSNYLKTFEFFDKQHLFFMEAITENYFKKPAKSYEKVIAHRTAGLKDPLVSIYLAKLQTINFYQTDMLDILESPYINPISQNALAIYDFHLDNTIFQETDTLFVISFKPKKNVHFKSLKGTVWITSQNYAFTKIEALPFDKALLGIKFNIMQEYEGQKNQTYFLKNMVVRVDFRNIGVSAGGRGEGGRSGDGVFVRPVIFSEKKIMDIDYETPIRNKEFGFADIEGAVRDENEQKKILETYRPVALTNKESNTLILIDSLTKPIKLDKRLEGFKILITGKIPVSFVNFDLTQILFFNSTEAVRLGLGVYTNDRLNKIMNFGGNFGYGFKDKKWKWGGELGFNIIRSRDFKATLHYFSTIVESGETVFYNRDFTLFSGEFYRSWLFKRFYRSDAFGVVVHSKITRWLTGYVSTFYSMNKTIYNYTFREPFVDEIPTTYSFNDYYVKVGARLAFKERFWGADKSYFYSVSPYPVVILQYSRGIKDVFHSDYNYNRIDLKISYRKNWKILGFTNLTVFAGYIDRPLPSPLLLNQRAGYYLVGLDGEENFGTMRADEFLSDKYVSVIIRHNFGRMTQNKKFSPRIIVCQGIGIGGLKAPTAHIGIDFKTMERGYFESGVIIGDLLVIKGLLSFGVGVFVRYGSYYLPKTIDNFAFKISFRVPFER